MERFQHSLMGCIIVLLFYFTGEGVLSLGFVFYPVAHASSIADAETVDQSSTQTDHIMRPDYLDKFLDDTERLHSDDNSYYYSDSPSYSYYSEYSDDVSYFEDDYYEDLSEPSSTSTHMSSTSYPNTAREDNLPGLRDDDNEMGDAGETSKSSVPRRRLPVLSEETNLVESDEYEDDYYNDDAAVDDYAYDFAPYRYEELSRQYGRSNGNSFSFLQVKKSLPLMN